MLSILIVLPINYNYIGYKTEFDVNSSLDKNGPLYSGNKKFIYNYYRNKQ